MMEAKQPKPRLFCLRVFALALAAFLLVLLPATGGGAAQPLPQLRAVDAPAAAAATPYPPPPNPHNFSPAELRAIGLHVDAPLLHLVWTKDMSFWSWIFFAVVESIFIYHPRARVTFYSVQMPLDFFACLSDAGFDIRVERYNLTVLAAGTEVEGLVASGRVAGSRYRYAHESDLVRIVILATRGGAYTDTDMLFLRPMDEHVLGLPSLGLETNARGVHQFHDPASTRLNNAFINFPLPGHPFLACMMSRIAPGYDPDEWAAIGPDLVTECHGALAPAAKSAFRILEPNDLYPLDWKYAWWAASVMRRGDLDLMWPPGQRALSYALHLYNSNSWNMQDIHENGVSKGGFEIMSAPLPGSWLAEALERGRLQGVQCEHLRKKGGVKR
jgi:hypothetical protein